MSDRELLELAAKAAGITKRERGSGCLVDNDDWIWDPITNDGQALRLAVKLGLLIDVDWALNCVQASTAVVCDDQVLGTDPYAATRRAIVRAAAAIGKGEA